MTDNRMEHFRSEFRRIRANIADAFHAHAEEEGSERRVSPRFERRPVLRTHLAIADVMEKNLATVLPESPVRPAVALMIEHRISSVPVVDADGRIVGALNEGDLMKVFYQLDTNRVADVMTRNPIIVSIDAPMVDVIDQLMSSDFRRVLIHENHRLVGVITRSHVMPALLAALEEGTITGSSSELH